MKISDTMSENRSEFKLKNGPEDGITAVRFGPSSSQFLLASSWDTNVRLYDVANNNLRLKYSHADSPVLSCAFQDPIHVWSGGKLIRCLFIISRAYFVDVWQNNSLYYSSAYKSTISLHLI